MYRRAMIMALFPIRHIQTSRKTDYAENDVLRSDRDHHPPGSVLLFGLVLYYPELQILAAKDGMSIDFGLFVLIAYASGQRRLFFVTDSISTC